MKKIHIENNKHDHRGVAPIIATLLMVAIAVVGGILIFVFAQGFFSDSQISSSPGIESISVFGYDLRDADDLTCATGETITFTHTQDNGKIDAGDEIIYFIRNDSPKDVILDSVKVGGKSLTYDNDDTITAVTAGSYVIGDATCANAGRALATVAGGETATIVANPNTTLKVGRELPINIKTASGNTFVGSARVGDTRGGV